MQVGQLGRISVGQLLYDSKSGSDFSTKNEATYDYHPSWKNLENMQRSIKELSKKRTIDDDEESSPKKAKTDQDFNFNSGVQALTLLSSVASDLFNEEKKSIKYSSEDTEDDLSDSDTISATKEDDYNPNPINKEKGRDYSPKLKAGQHHSKRRHRTTPEQLRKLESTYLKEKMPNQELRESLAKELNMTPRRVQIWFQNKRAKEKRSKSPSDSILSSHGLSGSSSSDSLSLENSRSNSDSPHNQGMAGLPIFYPIEKNNVERGFVSPHPDASLIPSKLVVLPRPPTNQPFQNWNSSYL